MGSNYSTILQTSQGEFKLDENPFAHGSNRKAYKATGVTGQYNNKKYVAKIPSTSKLLLSFYENHQDITNMSLCRTIVDSFKHQIGHNNSNSIIVNDSMICMVKEQSNYKVLWFIPVYYGPFKEKLPIWVEPELNGKFIKFNNNFKYIGDHSKTIQALSHFSWMNSKGKILLCDLQGVKTEKGYILTDPAILSTKCGKYGLTDLGPTGIMNFFNAHVCNDICNKWPVPKIKNNKWLLELNNQTDSCTTYSFNLKEMGFTIETIKEIEEEYEKVYNED